MRLAFCLAIIPLLAACGGQGPAVAAGRRDQRQLSRGRRRQRHRDRRDRSPAAAPGRADRPRRPGHPRRLGHGKSVADREFLPAIPDRRLFRQPVRGQQHRLERALSGRGRRRAADPDDIAGDRFDRLDPAARSGRLSARLAEIPHPSALRHPAGPGRDPRDPRPRATAGRIAEFVVCRRSQAAASWRGR